MKPIYQKNIYDDGVVIGDCLRASICSIMEISDEGVPNFVEDKNYPEQLYNFLYSKGYHINYEEGFKPEAVPKDVKYYMAWGDSPRGLLHSVIYCDGKLVHDPHPEGGGVNPIKFTVWIEKIKEEE